MSLQPRLGTSPLTSQRAESGLGTHQRRASFALPINLVGNASIFTDRVHSVALQVCSIPDFPSQQVITEREMTKKNTNAKSCLPPTPSTCRKKKNTLKNNQPNAMQPAITTLPRLQLQGTETGTGAGTKTDRPKERVCEEARGEGQGGRGGGGGERRG